MKIFNKIEHFINIKVLRFVMINRLSQKFANPIEIGKFFTFKKLKSEKGHSPFEQMVNTSSPSFVRSSTDLINLIT